MALLESIAIAKHPSSQAVLASVPLARRNLLADRRRLLRALAGIAFAVLLMMVELGFRTGFIGSMLLPIYQLDGDLMLLSSTKYEFGRKAPFSRRLLYEARAVPGIASVRPLYLERRAAAWKNPQTLQLFGIQVFGFDPDQPVFLLPELADKLEALREPDTVMVDRRARGNLGQASAGTQTELSRHHISVIGTFRLGPSFFSDGTVIMSDRNFFKLFGGRNPNSADRPDVEIGVVKVLPGQRISDVQQALRAALPSEVTVLTKAELIDREARFHLQVSPVGPIFDVGTLVGFAVGILICYQILFSELSDQLSQYATLKAMGYYNGFLLKIVLQQAVFYALLAYIVAWVACYMIFLIVGEIALIPLRMTVGLTVMSVVLALTMCIGAALIAVRRVLATDPAELF
jgi:putative ABC transport system permease protein